MDLHTCTHVSGMIFFLNNVVISACQCNPQERDSDTSGIYTSAVREDMCQKLEVNSGNSSETQRIADCGFIRQVLV